jgi:hypothetical protein
MAIVNGDKEVPRKQIGCPFRSQSIDDCFFGNDCMTNRWEDCPIIKDSERTRREIGAALPEICPYFQALRDKDYGECEFGFNCYHPIEFESCSAYKWRGLEELPDGLGS